MPKTTTHPFLSIYIFLSIVSLGVRAAAVSAKQENEPMTSKETQQCGLPLSDAELRQRLTPEQYRVMRQNGTELPFANAYWNNHRAGLYVDAITGKALFTSRDKFDSGTGWPSFTKPISPEQIIEKIDDSHGMQRTEVRSASSHSHLGHVFHDGPGPTKLRYCLNSASLRFIPVEELEQEGYGQYRALFQEHNTR